MKDRQCGLVGLSSAESCYIVLVNKLLVKGAKIWQMNNTSLQCFAVLEQKPKTTVFSVIFRRFSVFFGCVNTDVGVGFGFSKNLGCRFRCRLTDPALL